MTDLDLAALDDLDPGPVFVLDPVEGAVWDALDSVMDPCHVLTGHDLSILDLGLVNRVSVSARHAEVGLTLTEVSCSFAYRIMEQIEGLADRLQDIDSLSVVIEPFPIWTEDRLSDRARNHYAQSREAFAPASFRSTPAEGSDHGRR